ncbi:unnamed protein product [Musa acuminata subsp. burmannicoides]
MAKPSSDASEVLFLGFQPSSAATPMVDQMKKGDEGTKGSVLRRNLEVDNKNRALKLGGGAYSVVEEPTARPYKRVRSGFQGVAAATQCVRWMIAGRIRRAPRIITGDIWCARCTVRPPRHFWESGCRIFRPATSFNSDFIPFPSLTGEEKL